MEQLTQWFPVGLATGDSFVNRTQEKEAIKSHVLNHQHVILVAPRRYGKSSLIHKVAEEMDLPYLYVDLLASYSGDYVRNQLMDKVGKFIFDLMPFLERNTAKLFNIFKSMRPEISLGSLGHNLILRRSEDSLKDIAQLLLYLDETAVAFEKKPIIFLDEFQQISHIKNHQGIEASIRHAVERSKNVVYVFSGSHRHLLMQMFGDSGRPLYRLCVLFSLERMKSESYETHLKKLAQKQWGQPLSAEVFERVIQWSELHPFYVNVLCQLLWNLSALPTLDDVDRCWHHYVDTQRHVIIYDLSEISSNQRGVLCELSRSASEAPFSVEFTSRLKLSASSVKQAMEVLRKRDLVYQDAQGYYRVLDPAIKYYLSDLQR